MKERYLIVFDDVGGHKAGETVKDSDVASDRNALAYLLDCGAIIAAKDAAQGSTPAASGEAGETDQGAAPEATEQGPEEVAASGDEPAASGEAGTTAAV